MEYEVQVILLAMVDIITIDLVVDVDGTPGGVDSVPPDYPYGGGSDSFSSCELGS